MRLEEEMLSGDIRLWSLMGQSRYGQADRICWPRRNTAYI